MTMVCHHLHEDGHSPRRAGLETSVHQVWESVPRDRQGRLVAEQGSWEVPSTDMALLTREGLGPLPLWAMGTVGQGRVECELP